MQGSWLFLRQEGKHQLFLVCFLLVELWLHKITQYEMLLRDLFNYIKKQQQQSCATIYFSVCICCGPRNELALVVSMETQNI